MANIKTAVSLQEQLFKQAELMAHDLKLSRSRLFAAALEEFIERHQNRQLLDRINKACEAADDSERKYLRRMRQRHRKSIEGEW